MMAPKYLGPVLSTIQDLASILEIDAATLVSLAENASNHYHRERPEWNRKDGKSRSITEPFEGLKAVQRKIVKTIFHHVDFPNYFRAE